MRIDNFNSQLIQFAVGNSRQVFLSCGVKEEGKGGKKDRERKKKKGKTSVNFLGEGATLKKVKPTTTKIVSILVLQVSIESHQNI